MTSTPQVDVEELKRQLRREVVGDLRPILVAQGMQFLDIGGVMSYEERRSSFASTTVGGRSHGEHQVPASRLIEGHEQPLPSIEPDTIDNLAQPTTCNLILLIRGSFRMEVRRWLVYPCQTMLNDVHINGSSYVVVKVDMVHENSKDRKLEVPSVDTTLTIWDTVVISVQWRQTSIDVDPSATTSASTTGYQLNTSHALIFPESVSKSRAIASVSNSRAAASVSNSRAAASITIQEQSRRCPPRTQST
jgi:hypothetical protein